MDVVALVGRMRFLESKRSDDIQKEMMDRYGIYVSAGSISAIGMEFLARLKCLHTLRFNRIKKDINDGGGYILGIDGTGDGDSDRIFLGMDLMRGWTLLSARIPSESEDNMKPHVEFLKEELGLPLASVCDMSKSMMNVLTSVMPGVPLRVCHYHLLKDIGSDLLRDDYLAVGKLIKHTKLQPYLKRLRKDMYHDLKKEKIDISKLARALRSGTVPHDLPVDACTKVQTYDTISWALRYHEDNAGMRFPFTLPYLNFYERCRKGIEAITAIRKIATNTWKSPKYLRDVENKLRYNLEEQNDSAKALALATSTLRESFGLFEDLRKILHIPTNKGDIPRDQLIIQNNEIIAKMRTQLKEFRSHLREKASNDPHTKEKIILEHLDKYWHNIILDNATVKIDGQDTPIVIPRTSSEYETCFGVMKGDLRKRLGKKDIGHELNMYGDYLCYVQNLKSERYVTLICDSLDNLPQALKEIPTEMVKSEIKMLHKRMKGYDVTNNRSRNHKVDLADILSGVEALDKWIDSATTDEQIETYPLAAGQPNGIMTL